MVQTLGIIALSLASFGTKIFWELLSNLTAVVLFALSLCGIMTIKFSGKGMVSKKVSKKALDVRDEQLRDYELVLIISPEIVDEALDTTIDNVSQLITTKGGIISNVEQWGKRKLAYPIGHFTEGNYVLTQLKLKPVLTKEVEANLQISEEILRHLLIRLSS